MPGNVRKYPLKAKFNVMMKYGMNGCMMEPKVNLAPSDL